MSLRFRVDRLANDDLRAAYHCYDDQRQGLGEEFADDVARVFERICEFPDSFEVVEHDVRVAALSRLPYLALFRTGEAGIVVLAVYHQRRDPKLWSSRLSH